MKAAAAATRFTDPAKAAASSGTKPSAAERLSKVRQNAHLFDAIEVGQDWGESLDLIPVDLSFSVRLVDTAADRDCKDGGKHDA